MISLVDVCLDYASGAGRVQALRGVSMDIEAGTFCALVGASGSGKTSLMNIIGLLDRPTSGRYWLDGMNTASLSASGRAALRNRALGFVFQSFHLLPQFSALENVGLPLVYSGMTRGRRDEAAARLLDRLGLGTLCHRRPAELSGGQRQRVAIARALVVAPSIILADEPTGNLDSRTASDIMALLAELNHELGLTIVMVTHDPNLARQCPVRFQMRDGLLDGSSPQQPSGLDLPT